MRRMFQFVISGIAFSLAACASNPITGTLDPVQASAKCLGEIPPPFLPDGHLYTTLSIASIAGLPDERQLALAYFSQYPDLDHDYEAVPVSVKYLFLPHKWNWRNDIAGKLHSLHGGDKAAIDARREEIRTALSNVLVDPAKDWMAGLLIHALGDTYAHTKNNFGSPDEKAYGVWIGHALPTLFCTSPDDIKVPQNESKYLGYITDLYKVFGGRAATDPEFQNFYKFVDQLECKGGQCPNFHALYHGQADTQSARIDQFESCMNNNMRQLTVAEVQSVMDLLSDSCEY